jgi:hypothetical protein
MRKSTMTMITKETETPSRALRCPHQPVSEGLRSTETPLTTPQRAKSRKQKKRKSQLAMTVMVRRVMTT